MLKQQIFFSLAIVGKIFIFRSALIFFFEWFKNGQKKVAFFIFIWMIYVIVTLLIIELHYTVDIFVGLYWSHYLILVEEKNHEKIENFKDKLYDKIH